MKEQPLVSIVLPVYNQADHVEAVVSSFIQALSRTPARTDFILVPNNCRDNSLEVCNELMEKFENVRAFYLEEGGWGRAVRFGLGKAAGDLLCYTNLARTTPEELSLMVLYSIVYPEVVLKANRKVRDSAFRRMGSLLYNIQCRSMFDIPNWDINGTPKIFSRSFDALLGLERNDDLIDLEFNVICRKMNYPIIEVPVFFAKRHGGKSTTNMKTAIRLYWGAYKMWRESV